MNFVVVYRAPTGLRLARKEISMTPEVQPSPQPKQARKKKRAARSNGYVEQRGKRLRIVFQDQNHRRVRENANTTDWKTAEDLLQVRVAEVIKKEYVAPTRVTVDEIVEAVLTDMRNAGAKSINTVEGRWRLHLKPAFTGFMAEQVTKDHIRKYRSDRLAEGAALATVNRELALLKHAYVEAGDKVKKCPEIKLPKENNTRKGFLEPAQFDRLAPECDRFGGAWFRALCELGYAYGFRMGELLAMKVEQVDLVTSSISLPPGSTKNGQAREVRMGSMVRSLLAPCLRGKQPTDAVFTRPDGSRVCGFRKNWNEACVAAGLGKFTCRDCGGNITGNRCDGCGKKWRLQHRVYKGAIFHDLRRSSVRIMVRSGVSQKIAQQISGHVTSNTFSRYNIINGVDLIDAASKIEAARTSRFVVPSNDSGPHSAPLSAPSGSQAQVPAFDPRLVN